MSDPLETEKEHHRHAIAWHREWLKVNFPWTPTPEHLYHEAALAAAMAGLVMSEGITTKPDQQVRFCGATHHGFFCAEPEGHTGEHVAHKCCGDTAHGGQCWPVRWPNEWWREYGSDPWCIWHGALLRTSDHGEVGGSCEISHQPPPWAAAEGDER